MKTTALAERLGLQPQAISEHRFADGASFRIEIPSVEGPRVMEAVLLEAERHNVAINRVSQGSGGILLTNAELGEMAAMGRDTHTEVCLFVGPRAGHDVGVLPHVDHAHYTAIRGLKQLSHAVSDVIRATEQGIRSFLVGDVGLLSVLTKLQTEGDLPEDCRWKVSAYLGVFNPASLIALAQLGASTVNIPADLSAIELSELRSAVQIPLDLYIEAPQDMGGTIRLAEFADLISVAAPLYVKFGLSNGPAVYPSSFHLTEVAKMAAREKVHRAAVALEWMERFGPIAEQSLPHRRAGVPV